MYTESNFHRASVLKCTQTVSTRRLSVLLCTRSHIAMYTQPVTFAPLFVYRQRGFSNAVRISVYAHVQNYNRGRAQTGSDALN